jgi:hypothetical protein
LKADVSRDFVIENYDKINHAHLALWNKNVSKELKDEVKMIEKLSGNNSYWVNH